MLSKLATVATAFILLSAIIFGIASTPHSAQAQSAVDSPNLATFVALMEYIRSTPTPADVHPDKVSELASFNSWLSDIYITGFITPFTGETSEQVKARLQSFREEDRFTAVMVESYRLASNDLLLDIMHTLLARYYVDIYTTSDLSDAPEFLKNSKITSRADAFDSSDYDIPDPLTIGTTSPLTQGSSDVDSANLATFVALMKYIRSTPTPADVHPDKVSELASFNSWLSDIYITGFITPFTGETPEQVKARLQSIREEDRFTAVMVESYRLASNDLLLDIMHTLLARYYVDIYTTSNLGDAPEFLKRTEITSRADAFDPTNYAIPAPSATTTPVTTPVATPSSTPAATSTPTIAQLVQNVQGGVVQIIALTGSGSGFIIDTDGRVATNQHVVSGNQSVTVRMHDGTEYLASVLGVDAVADLAIVDIVPEIALTPVPLGDSALVQLGEKVVAIGYPLGYQLGQSMVVTDGIISSKQVKNGVELLQTNAAINPGNSGGPLFNRAGQVIGVNTSKLEYTPDGRPVDNTAFAVAINELKSRLSTLTSGGSPQPVTTPTPVPTPVTPVPTPSAAPTPPPLQTGWERYNNGVYGFSVDTPPGWAINEETEEDYYAYFSPTDNKAGVTVKAYDLPSSYSLQALAEWRRDWLTEYARDNSWDVFEITAFTKKREGGKEFYEFAYRHRSTDEFCVSRDVERIYISSWYPDKPHGYRVGTGVCELHLSRYPSATTNAIQNSFTEWMPYWNATHAFGLNVAPGWTLETESETDDYAAFWAPGKQGIFEIEAFGVGASETLEDFTNWRIEVLNRISRSWEVFEPVGSPSGFGGVPGAREGYLIGYVVQTDSESCISGNVELLVLSSYHPEHEYGFLVVTGVCGPIDDLYDRYDDERLEMLNGFRY